MRLKADLPESMAPLNVVLHLHSHTQLRGKPADNQCLLDELNHVFAAAHHRILLRNLHFQRVQAQARATADGSSARMLNSCRALHPALNRSLAGADSSCSTQVLDAVAHSGEGQEAAHNRLAAVASQNLFAGECNQAVERILLTGQLADKVALAVAAGHNLADSPAAFVRQVDSPMVVGADRALAAVVVENLEPPDSRHRPKVDVPETVAAEAEPEQVALVAERLSDGKVVARLLLHLLPQM